MHNSAQKVDIISQKKNSYYFILMRKSDMSLNNVPAGRDVPNDFNVIIEIPMNADPIKYEVDKETGAIFVDRFMGTAMHYPCNYGYVPQTIAGDGDPVDVLVITPFPLIPHFFEHYKDLEKGKWVKVEGWGGPEEAKKEILAGIENFKKA